MAKPSMGSKPGNATVKMIGHTAGQQFGTNPQAQAPMKQTPKDLHLK